MKMLEIAMKVINKVVSDITEQLYRLGYEIILDKVNIKTMTREMWKEKLSISMYFCKIGTDHKDYKSRSELISKRVNIEIDNFTRFYDNDTEKVNFNVRLDTIVAGSPNNITDTFVSLASDYSNSNNDIVIAIPIIDNDIYPSEYKSTWKVNNDRASYNLMVDFLSRKQMLNILNDPNSVYKIAYFVFDMN